MKKINLLIPLVLAATLSVHAQSIGPKTVNSAGHTANIGGNEFDWSVGEMAMVSTFSASTIVITQGLLQPAHVVTEGVSNTGQLTKQVEVFPNPATSEVNIKFSAPADGSLSYRLVDMTGQVINSQSIKVTQGTTTEKINVTNLACATYMLEVSVDAGSTPTESMSIKFKNLNNRLKK